jgi:A/G-specific adenine glycosylase
MVYQTKLVHQAQAAHRELEIAAIRRRLLEWYQKHKRDLPWRRTRDPYGIWISEIMLQQTRAAAVIPYYERFLALFPDAPALASAPEQDLLAAWAGLGYYARARNLQKAARLIVELPRFPSDYAGLRQLPGVGDYTAAAVASIAFGKPHAVLDGNVLRVLSRMVAEQGDIKSPAVRRGLATLADKLLHRARPGEFNQALMELGATVCVPKPMSRPSALSGAPAGGRKSVAVAGRASDRGAAREALARDRKRGQNPAMATPARQPAAGRVLGASGTRTTARCDIAGRRGRRFSTYYRPYHLLSAGLSSFHPCPPKWFSMAG